MSPTKYSQAVNINRRIRESNHNIELLQKGVDALRETSKDSVMITNFCVRGVGDFPFKYAESPSFDKQLLIDMLNSQIMREQNLLLELANEFEAL